MLKEDLQTMRTAIDTYTMDKQKAPQSLDDLVQDGYLKAIPEDPMTHSKDTWVTDTSDAMYSIDETEPGITDVHSGSTRPAPTGNRILPGNFQDARRTFSCHRHTKRIR